MLQGWLLTHAPSIRVDRNSQHPRQMEGHLISKSVRWEQDYIFVDRWTSIGRSHCLDADFGQIQPKTSTRRRTEYGKTCSRNKKEEEWRYSYLIKGNRASSSKPQLTKAGPTKTRAC